MLMQKHNEYFIIAIQKGKSSEGIMRTKEQGNKFEYFMMIVPQFQTGKVWFAEELESSSDMQELLTELSYVTHLGIGSKSDAGLDVISQLTQLNIRIPQFENPRLPNGNQGHMTSFKGKYWDAEIVQDEDKSSYVF